MEAAFVTVILHICLTTSSPPKCTLNCLCISGELRDLQSTFPRTTCGRLWISVIQNEILFWQHTEEQPYQLFLLTCVSLMVHVKISDLNVFNSELDLNEDMVYIGWDIITVILGCASEAVFGTCPRLGVYCYQYYSCSCCLCLSTPDVWISKETVSRTMVLVAS